MVDEGKRQFKMEIVAAFRLTADRLGDGRDPALIVENDNKGNRGGFGHRKPATSEFVLSLTHFFLMGKAAGFCTSQCCSCCGVQTEFGDRKNGVRSKVCNSPNCPGTAKMAKANKEAAKEQVEGTQKPARKKGKRKAKSQKADAADTARKEGRPFFFADRDVMAGVNDKAEPEERNGPNAFRAMIIRDASTSPAVNSLSCPQKMKQTFQLEL